MPRATERRLCDGGDDTPMTRTLPRQRGQVLMSIANTRRRRCIQLIAVVGLASRMSSPGCAVGAGLATMWSRCICRRRAGLSRV